MSAQVLRALRGKRSQVAASRRLGYSSNVFAEWEAGRRTPTAAEVVRACGVLGVDAAPAFAHFVKEQRTPPETRPDVAKWLSALRGERSLQAIAASTGLSRHQVSRFFSGKTAARLHEFFLLLQACTGRLPDFVSQLVDISAVPTLSREYERIVASRTLSFEKPWVSAILAALDALPALVRERAVGVLAQGLRLPPPQVAEYLDALERAGIVAWTERGVQLVAPLLVDTGDNPNQARELRHHWSQVAADRAAKPGPSDLFSYNVFSISKADFQRLRAMQQSYYRRVRELIAQSPPETAALLNLQLMEWRLDAD